MFARTLVLGVVKGLVSEEFVLCYGCESRRRSRNTLEGTVEQISFQQNYYFATSCPFFRHHLGGELLAIK